jgi:hypothetical protein
MLRERTPGLRLRAGLVGVKHTPRLAHAASVNAKGLLLPPRNGRGKLARLRNTNPSASPKPKSIGSESSHPIAPNSVPVATVSQWTPMNAAAVPRAVAPAASLPFRRVRSIRSIATYAACSPARTERTAPSSSHSLHCGRPVERGASKVTPEPSKYGAQFI